MDGILLSFKQALGLILSFDRELVGIVLLSLEVSLAAVVIATVLGLPTAYLLAVKRPPLNKAAVGLLNTGMGLPPVVVGLFLYLLLSRSGPLGGWGLLYSPGAMIIAQTILAFPIISALSYSALAAVKPTIRLAARGLGAGEIQASLTMLKEARPGIFSALMAGLGRLLAEVAAVLIVGGNIAGYTRTMTTTIALEYDKGNFELAIALGIILLLISLCINLVLLLFREKARP